MLLSLLLSRGIELNRGPATHYITQNYRVPSSNIQSLWSNFPDLPSCGRNFDLMILSETLVSINRSKGEFLIPEFDSHDFIYCRNILHTQGIAVYTKLG